MEDDGKIKFYIFSMDRIKEAMILVPWISWKVMSDRFNPIEDRAKQEWCTVFRRFNAWEDQEALEDLSVTEIHERLYELIDEIGGKVHIIWKSFWWGITLLSHHPNISKMTLLSPAIGIWDTCMDVFRWVQDFKKRVTDLDVLRILEKDIAWITIPIHLIHGTADTTIPLQNSEDILKRLSNGEMSVIEGANHSFSDSQHEWALIGRIFS